MTSNTEAIAQVVPVLAKRARIGGIESEAIAGHLHAGLRGSVQEVVSSAGSTDETGSTGGASTLTSVTEIVRSFVESRSASGTGS